MTTHVDVTLTWGWGMRQKAFLYLIWKSTTNEIDFRLEKSGLKKRKKKKKKLTK